jgi:hypothetical protein
MSMYSLQAKNEFFKSLSLQLRNLKRADMTERAKQRGFAIFAEFTEDEDDSEYGKPRTKHRKTGL